MMKNMKVWGILVLLICSLALPAWAGKGTVSGSSTGNCTGGSEVTAVPTDSVDEDSDRPDYAGIPGNETKPGSGNEEPGIAMGDLYGDLLIIVRDDNGEPILYEWFVNDQGNLEYFQSDNGFVQPLAADGELPEFGDYIPLNEEGEILEAYAEYSQEVDFGRLNVARAPQSFLDRAYAEALSNINAAEAISYDASGRLLLIRIDEETGELEEKAVDSPRENLALYQKLMRNGYLTGITRTDMGTLSHLLPVTDPTVAETLMDSDLNLAASFLAAAADKTGSINLDMVIYLNAILGLNGDEGTAYFNFTGYQYQRGNRHGQPEAEVLIGPYYGYGNNPNVAWFTIGTVSILDKVFGNDDSVQGTNARGFAKASDDALKVINYVHNWEVPEY